MSVESTLPDWYPEGVVYDPTIAPDAYGPANARTLQCFSELSTSSNIVDVAGGYGRYAVPLAEAGYTVTLLDIDEAHLDQAELNALSLPEGAGSIKPIKRDVLKDDLSDFEPFDASLCTGFIYLAPEDVVQDLFAKMVSLTKPGGPVVIEFATDRIRRQTSDATSKSLIGRNETLYSYEQGLDLLRSLYKMIGGAVFSRSSVRLNQPYYLRSTVITAKGYAL
jgi:SAM-dependent methyltransferase